MTDNKAGQPNRTAPHVTLRNAKPIIYQRSDSKRSQQHVNQFQEHLIFGDSCPETKRALKAVCTPHNYQGTLLMLIYLAGCIDQETRETIIGSDTLANRMGINRDTSDEQLKRLQESGIVTIQGKHGRAYKRKVTLPCNHLDVVADSSGDSSGDSPADNYAESPADNYADTYPHYQVRKRTEQEQQQSDPAAGYSLAEREKILSKLNDGLPKRKQVGLTKQVHQFFDSWADNCVPVGSIIQQLHNEQPRWDSGGGTIDALKRITDQQAATRHERQPKPVQIPCTGLDADQLCDNTFHTTIGDTDAPVVTKCPQRKVTS
jgi:hypothetical protein